jgi:hypothetical protein
VHRSGRKSNDATCHTSLFVDATFTTYARIDYNCSRLRRKTQRTWRSRPSAPLYHYERSLYTAVPVMADENSVEALQERCRALEAECHTLLNRSIQSEQMHSEAAAERDRLQAAVVNHKEDLSRLETRISALKKENDSLAMQLAEQAELVGGDRDIKSTLENEKANAKRANELRIELESNFAELSVQFDSLQSEHEDLRAKYGRTSRDLETALSEVESLSATAKAMEEAAAMAGEERDSAVRARDKTAQELAKERKAHDKTKEENSRLQNSLNDLRGQHDELLNQHDKLKKDYEALKKKAAIWKKQAEAARDLELRNEQLVAQFNFSQKELADARKEITRLQAQLLSIEDEDRLRRQGAINPKMLQYLRDQLAEANERLKELRAKEKTWGDQVAAFQAQVKRLKYELAKRNPSQLRLMEMEVQNELLLGMLQSTNSPPRQRVSTIPKAAGAVASRTPGPRKLPPLQADAPTPSSVTPEPQADRKPTPATPTAIAKSASAAALRAVEDTTVAGDRPASAEPRRTPIDRARRRSSATAAAASNNDERNAASATGNSSSQPSAEPPAPSPPPSEAAAEAPAPAPASSPPPPAREVDQQDDEADEEEEEEEEYEEEFDEQPSKSESPTPAPAPKAAAAPTVSEPADDDDDEEEDEEDEEEEEDEVPKAAAGGKTVVGAVAKPAAPKAAAPPAKDVDSAEEGEEEEEEEEEYESDDE